MKSDRLDLEPVRRLLGLHSVHKEVYPQEFLGLALTMYPEVFNPEYTNVSKLFGQYLIAHKNIPHQSILDMFCGSGALGILLADKLDRLVGLDISDAAIKCSRVNARNSGFINADYRQSNLWSALKPEEKFDVILANPPLLPAEAETILEMAVADSPGMKTTTEFIKKCATYLSKNGVVLMAFSNASKAYFKNPLEHIRRIANKSGLKLRVVAKKDVGYEIYRILELRRR